MSVTEEEAAAALAAVEQFLADTIVVVAPVEEPGSPWLRIARLEAIDRDPARDPW